MRSAFHGFLTPDAPLRLAWCGLGLEAEAQLLILFFKNERKREETLKCNLPGGCLKGWSLSHLTQGSYAEEQQPRMGGESHRINHLNPYARLGDDDIQKDVCM